MSEPGKRPVGRPRSVVPTNAARRIRDLASDGFSLLGIATKLGTNRKTLNRWMEEDEAIREAFDVGREQERHALHNKLYRLAIDDGNPIAAMFLLKSRHGYREGDQGDTANKVSITFNLPGAMQPAQFIEAQLNEPARTSNLALPAPRPRRA